MGHVDKGRRLQRPQASPRAFGAGKFRLSGLGETRPGWNCDLGDARVSGLSPDYLYLY